MNRTSKEELINLYLKERGYEETIFGDYKNDPSLSFPSFLVFLKEYIDKAIKSYAGKWEIESPPWLETCQELENNGVAPVKAYEEVIKIMALSGAALETFAKLNANEWRSDPEKDSQKWKNQTKKENS